MKNPLLILVLFAQILGLSAQNTPLPVLLLFHIATPISNRELMLPSGFTQPILAEVMPTEV